MYGPVGPVLLPFLNGSCTINAEWAGVDRHWVEGKRYKVEDGRWSFTRVIIVRILRKERRTANFHRRL
jgi:hypothetical protein